MKRKTFVLCILLVAVFAILVVGYAEKPEKEKEEEKEKLILYQLLATIDIPGGLTGFDISWVDSESGRYYLTSCGDVITIATGAIVHVAGVGGDEIWFNRGDERVYFGGGLDRISVPVVNALSPYNLITTLVVGQILVPPPNAANHTTHSVAADSELNRIFVP